ncbi:MAG: Y-family DNA polymerase [Saprospiraceae bacterium]|nr:Y-family DNA polymerase [Saprospiraceae bacterium]
MIALVDCNNFYASCEKVFRPDLRYRPVVVLSNNDGCIIARSQEAKELGIDMTQPYFKVKDELARQGVAVFSSNYTLYGDMSARVVECIERLSPNVEVYSVDEAFADLSMIPTARLQSSAEALVQQIWQWTGLPVKIGVGPSKTLSKVAAKLAKKRASRAFVMYDDQQIEHILKETPAGDLWGVGRAHRDLLWRFGIETAWEFAQRNDAWIRKHMGVVGVRMAHELRSSSCLKVDAYKKPRKNIMTGRSFNRAVTNLSDMKEAVATYTARCAEKLRQEHQTASIISVFIRTYEHRKDLPQNNASFSMALPAPYQSTHLLTKAAYTVLERIYKDGYRYKKAGVLLSGLQPLHSTQLTVFERHNRQRNHHLMHAVDALNFKHGTATVKELAEGINPEWKMRFKLCSSTATSSWKDLITVKT